MQGGDHRHLQPAQEFQDVSARGSAKNAVFVLQAYEVNVAEIQEIRCLAVGSNLILGKFEPDPGRVGVAFWGIVDGKREEFGGAEFRVDRVAQVGREGGDTALPRKVVADDGDAAR